MARVTSSLMVEYSSATGGWRSYLDYTVSTSSTAVTITCKGGVCSDYWSFAITSGITSTLSCTGQSSTSGSGGLSSHWSSDVYNQLVSKTYTITRTSSAQSITIKCSTTNASGYINGTAVASVTITVPALEIQEPETYTIKYVANGGFNAPENQIKTEGVDLILSTVIPVRGGYTFDGWSASAAAKEGTYSAGESYSVDGNAILYAIWKFNNARTFFLNIPDGVTAEGIYFKIPDGKSLSNVYIKMYEDDSRAVLSTGTLGNMRLGVM